MLVATDSVTEIIDELCSRYLMAWIAVRCFGFLHMRARCIIFSGSSSTVHPCVLRVLLAASSSVAVLLAEGAAVGAVVNV